MATSLFQILKCARKKGKNQLQNASHVRAILEYLDPREEDITVLTEDEGYIVWTDFVDPRMDEIKGGTLRSYLISYEIFLSFVMIERVRKGIVPEVDSDSMRIFKNTIPRLKGWRKTVHLEKKSQDILTECDRRLTTEDVNDFYKSDLVEETVQICK